jgi:ribonucleotide reductase alpha subunit
MPTVSTSQVMGNNESFEPYMSNIYNKITLGCTITVINVDMIRHLIELGLWNPTIRDRIIAAGGSVMGIEEIPAAVREIYRTVWEMPQTEIMRRAALRGAFIDQSQSLNIHLRDPSESIIRGVFRHGFDLGLKTISYYVRTPPATTAIKTGSVARLGGALRASGTPQQTNAVPATAIPSACAFTPGCTSCSS